MAEMAIIVEFETKPGSEEAFIAHISDHARRTLAEEPGCLRFEVIKPIERDGTPIPNRVLVNELYADIDAVTAHERNPRMPALSAVLAPLLASRRLILAQKLNGSGPSDEGLRPQDLNAENDG